jgi:hypothetical protein
MCGSARIRAHCAGSLGSNGFWESNASGHRLMLGQEKKKAPAVGSLCLVRRIEWAWEAATRRRSAPGGSGSVLCRHLAKGFRRWVGGLSRFR